MQRITLHTIRRECDEVKILLLDITSIKAQASNGMQICGTSLLSSTLIPPLPQKVETKQKKLIMSMEHLGLATLKARINATIKKSNPIGWSRSTSQRKKKQYTWNIPNDQVFIANWWLIRLRHSWQRKQSAGNSSNSANKPFAVTVQWLSGQVCWELLYHFLLSRSLSLSHAYLYEDG